MFNTRTYMLPLNTLCICKPPVTLCGSDLQMQALRAEDIQGGGGWQGADLHHKHQAIQTVHHISGMTSVIALLQAVAARACRGQVSQQQL